MSQSPPSTLGKYQIIREIARSNDIVYEAYDPLMNRRVAVKELAMPKGATQQQQEERLKRFHREAKAAGSLAHPNIVTIYEVGEEGDRHFIAMEYLDGHNLRNELDTHGFLPQDRAVEIISAVLKGLEFAHQRGIVHRDIKPDNIQLLSDGSIKLTDFGIARLTFEPNLTMDGQVFGTPSYMSPEQVVGREIDARSDLFSAASVLYEMLAGQKAFSGDSVVSISYAIMNKEPDRSQQINYAIWQVLEKALDKSPTLRYSSAQEMLEAVQSAHQSSAAGPVLDPSAPASPYASYPAPTYNPYAPPPLSGQTGNYPYPPLPQPGAPYSQGGGQQQGPLPPITYPYNPYQNPPQHPPMTGSTIPPPTQPVQVYYPPPPRAPLLKPEQRMLLNRIIWTFVVLAAFFALIMASLSIIFPPDRPNPSRRSVLGEASTGEARDFAANRESGSHDLRPGDRPVIDVASEVRRAQELYASAMATADWRARVDLLQSAASAFAEAFYAERDVRARQNIGDATAACYYELARTKRMMGDLDWRGPLYKGTEFASPGSPIEQTLRSEIGNIG
jgi:eukaryotic-like serine/threonine-protein kinase